MLLIVLLNIIEVIIIIRVNVQWKLSLNERYYRILSRKERGYFEKRKIQIGKKKLLNILLIIIILLTMTGEHVYYNFILKTLWVSAIFKDIQMKMLLIHSVQRCPVDVSKSAPFGVALNNTAPRRLPLFLPLLSFILPNKLWFVIISDMIIFYANQP